MPRGNPSMYNRLGIAQNGSAIHSWDEWSSQDQIPESSNTESFLATAGVLGTTLGIHSLAQRPIKNFVAYNYIYGAARAVEEYSPAFFMRTFQAGNFLSQFTTYANQERVFSSEMFLKNKIARAYISQLIGGGISTSDRLMKEGVTFRGKKLYWGATQEIALNQARVILNSPIGGFSHPSAYWSAGYARSIGIDDFSSKWVGPKLENFFSQKSDEVTGFGLQVIGGKSHLQNIRRQFGAWGSELVGRFNRLLNAPFELPPLKQGFSAIRGAGRKVFGEGFLRYGFGVKPGGAGKTLARLAGKWGVLATLGYLGYQEIDRLTRNSELLDSTILEEGTSVGAATLWAKTNIATSKFADITGLHSYREKQEEIAPGSTSLAKLLAFPISGALIAGTSMYTRRLSYIAKAQQRGTPLIAASRLARESASKWGSGILWDSLKKVIDKTPLKNSSPLKSVAIAGAVAGAALALPFLPGALVPSERPEELRQIYSGEKEVAVRKGRWWEMGSSPWEGGRIKYFAPHWVHRMRARATQKAIWGDDADSMSEFEKYYKKEFTYELEKRHYKERPFPLTGTAFEDVPLIGPLLSSTIGQLIKPAKLMHAEEWMAMNEKGEKIYSPSPRRFGDEFNPELGDIPEGAPVSPHSLSQVAGEQIYRLAEMVGLPGFVSGAFKEKITGSQDWFDDYRQLESARRMFGAERLYWDEELGGVLGGSEWYRRLYPHRRRQIDLYNPIRNMMPTWLPGEGEKSEDFLSGDPYSKIPLGEVRLPGRGYEALHPELKGMDPEDYPLLHQYKILSDVAPYSEAFKKVTARLSSYRAKNGLSPTEELMYQNAKDQLKQKKESNKKFYDYKYSTPYSNAGSKNNFENQILAEINKQRADISSSPGFLASTIGKYWESISRGTESISEQITPIAPIGKLVHMRDAIEDYERSQLYGTDMALWQQPIKNFVKPFLASAANETGWAGVPGDKQKVRDLEEYFDQLKFIKYHKLALSAKASGEMADYSEFKKKKRETLFGINPYTQNPSNIFRALPKRERDYFKKFSEAQTSDERARILEMVPGNEKALYISQWQQNFINNAVKAEKKGLIQDSLKGELSRLKSSFEKDKSNEGFIMTDDLKSKYFETKLEGESYPDWYRRNIVLPSKMKDKPLPGPDWVGWSPHVDLEDVKLKVVQNMGENMYDYNLWNDRARALRYKPYISEAVESLSEQKYNESEIRDRLDQLFWDSKMKSKYSMNYTRRTDAKNVINVNVRQSRDVEIQQLLLEQLNE